LSPVVWSETKLKSYLGRSLLKLLTSGNKIEVELASFKVVREAGRDRLGLFHIPCGEKFRGAERVFIMTNILRFIQIFALGTWVGSIFYFSAAVAPGAFRVLSNPDQAGAVVQFTLGRLHMLGVVAAVLYLFASIALAQSFKGLVRPAAIGVLLMLLLTLTSQRLVTPRLAALRAQMGSVAATPKTDPLRVEFDHLHGISVKIEGAVLLIGFAALFLTVRQNQ
jgi:uncharacterized membrane protein